MLAIIKALYIFTILPETESSANGRISSELPPTITSCGEAKPLFIKISFTSAALSFGYKERIIAATPATAGEAIDVPCKNSYSSFGVVDQILVPGAKTSTLVCP